jgi:hypothetical protein
MVRDPDNPRGRVTNRDGTGDSEPAMGPKLLITNSFASQWCCADNRAYQGLTPPSRRTPSTNIVARSRLTLSYIEKQLESVIHVELLVAMKKSQAFHRRRHIHLDLIEALHQHDVFQDAGCGFAVNLRQLKAVAMQMDGMSIISLVVKCQAIALSLLKRPRLSLFVEARPVDRPAIEPSLAAIDFSE